MKKRFLPFLAVLFFTSWAQAQIIGTTNYDLSAGTIVTATNTATSIVYDEDTDGANATNSLTISNGTGGQFAYNTGEQPHGVNLVNGNTISMSLTANATVTFSVCQYSTPTAVYEFKNSGGDVLGSIAAYDATDGASLIFSNTGVDQVVTATLVGTKAYLHAISISNPEAVETLNGKTEVWDFGAEQFDAATYINRLDVDAINAWYTYTGEQAAGQPGRNVPASFSAGSLEWTSTSASSDRLRTTNTSLTRYDENCLYAPYTGRLYINGTAQTGRFFSLTLDEDDEVTIVALSQNGTGIMNFVSVANPEEQTDLANLTGTPTEFDFVAKKAGVYRVYDTVDKPSYFRIYRKNAVYSTVSGTVDVTSATGIPAEYTIVFTNEAGKSWSAAPAAGSYSIDLPTGYTYTLSLANANGYVVSSAGSIDVTAAMTNNVVVEKVALNTVTGTIIGLGANLANLNLVYSADDATKIFIPEVDINTTDGTYSVQLEPNTAYTITAEGVNDYTIGTSTITITADQTGTAVAFTAKPTYAISLPVTGLTTEQLAALSVTFTNVSEEGYAYTYTELTSVALRDGVYAISYSGLDAFTVEMAVTSNLTVNGAVASKALNFSEVTNWSFDDKAFSSTLYKGLVFSPAVANEVAKGHIGVDPATTITIPITNGKKVIVTYYYSGKFTIDGGATVYTPISSLGTTSSTEVAEYVYEGTGSSIDIVVGDTKTYFTNIQVVDNVPFYSEITVGADKDYQTINAALKAISLMSRPNNERVNVVIDPGNYEEMLVINVDSVSFSNASVTPSIALKDAGVNIDDNAVRVTSYYGHGYNYYSMSSDQKWHADVLAANKENGYLSYENKGSGTTNGSFWNATVVVTAAGFEANNIIFENSFNQYISQKESEDVVVEWTNGSIGERPTTVGNTAVQGKAFVERAAAIAVAGGDKMILNNCRLVGRQDVFYGGIGSRVAIYKGNMMGGTDYIFGGMTAVFYKSALAMNTSEDSNDVSYLTAGQQGSGNRGYLMYECTITSAIPGVDNTSTYRSKPGSFGRCWSGPTCEVLFYNTTIETSNNPSFDGLSLITPTGWSTGLGGPSLRVGEFGTVELSGTDNSSNRYSGAEVTGDWGTTVLESALTRNDALALTPFNFTKGSDSWNPIAELVAADATAVDGQSVEVDVSVYAYGNSIFVSNVVSNVSVNVYNMNGSLVRTFVTNEDLRIAMPAGLWIVNVSDASGSKSVKVITQE